MEGPADTYVLDCCRGASAKFQRRSIYEVNIDLPGAPLIITSTGALRKPYIKSVTVSRGTQEMPIQGIVLDFIIVDISAMRPLGGRDV